MPAPPNRVPIADLKLVTPVPIRVGQEVVVDASGTTDTDGPTNKIKNVFYWGQDNNKTTYPGKPGTATYPRGYDVAGVYDIVYEVIDHKGGKDTAKITVDVLAVTVPPPVPVDCVLGAAVDGVPEPWGPCQPTGTQTRAVPWTKAILTAPANGGVPCGPTSGTRTEEQRCDYVPPPGDCQYAPFGPWVHNAGSNPLTATRTRVLTQGDPALCTDLSQTEPVKGAVLSDPVDGTPSTWAQPMPNHTQMRALTWTKTVLEPPTGGGPIGAVKGFTLETRPATFIAQPMPVSSSHAHDDFVRRTALASCALSFTLREPATGLVGLVPPHSIEQDFLRIRAQSKVSLDGVHCGIAESISPQVTMAVRFAEMGTTAYVWEWMAGPNWNKPAGFFGGHKWINLRKDGPAIFIEPAALYEPDGSTFISRLRTYGAMGPNSFRQNGGFDVVGAGGNQVTSAPATTLRLIGPTGDVIVPTIVPPGTRYRHFDSDACGPVKALVILPNMILGRFMFIIEQPGDGFLRVTYVVSHEGLAPTVVVDRLQLALANDQRISRFDYEINSSGQRVRDDLQKFELVPTADCYARDVTVHRCSYDEALATLLTQPVP